MANERIKEVIRKPTLLFFTLGHRGFLNWMSDETFLRIAYRIKMGKKLNLEQPRTFNEKLQWLKLYDRKEIYTRMVDKYEAKKYVASIIGEEYIIPTFGVWDKFDEIDFSKLPNQFVLKCTHDSGGLVICRDKKKLDIGAAKKKINKSLAHNFFWAGREWPYKNVKPRIIAEKYMEDSEDRALKDYKFFTFGSKARILFIAKDRGRQEETKFDFFDMDFNHLDLKNGHLNSTAQLRRPKEFEKMKNLAEKLSACCPELRVNFYEVDEKIYFGELTFFHWSGLVPFDPEEWDETLGSWTLLPDTVGGGYYSIDDGFVLWIHKIPKNRSLIDYKFFCFSGEPQLLYISKGLEHHPTAQISFYDMEGKEMFFHRADYAPYHNAFLPERFDDMKKLASKLAKKVNNDFVRIDLYSINDKIYFSEVTFSPCSGMIPFEPSNADDFLGEYINIK